MFAIAKILVVFLVMLAMTRIKVPLGAALIGGGLALNLWAGIAPVVMAANLGDAFMNPDLWMLLAITAMIVEIGRFMTAGDNAAQIVGAIQRWGGRHGRAWTLMALPATMGLVPMPAGALFSAPFVQQAGGEEGNPPWKTAVNYWFRHIWEHWWPLYPGVIVAMSVFEIDAWHFVGAEILFTPISALAGYLFLVRPHMRRLELTASKATGDGRRALFLMLPIFLVVVLFLLLPLGLDAVFPGLGTQRKKMLGLLLALAAALVLVVRDSQRTGRDGPRHRVFSAVFSSRSLNILSSLGGVLVFKSLLDASGLLPGGAAELAESGIPLPCAVAALPFLAGLVTGIAVGFTGTAFPLVVGMMEVEGSGLRPLATLVLAYGFGFTGMMLSPVHLCLVTTREYFSSSYRATVRHLLPCVAVVMIWSLVSHFVLQALGW